MRLKSIKLAGFKSFVDPTTVHFPGNMSAVVGPNGCGKSNIIDAVRWVMGESSAKHLRGESMTDVIFNGSGGRKPVGQASIELVFDNSDGTLVGEYAGYSEISVRRKVTRDGQSTYYLNGNKCRRRDITDIFLGTGLGPRSYAIIEQGMISNLIEARPDELRVFIEEAAGISKYKERRRDTENRIRRTQENLERLTDLRDELERQLSRLERQAKAAEQYAEYKKQERALKAQLQALRWQQLDGELQKRRLGARELEVAVEALVTERAAGDTALEKLRDQHADCNDRFNAIQGEYYGLGADIARLEQGIQHSLNRVRELQTELEQTERNCQESETHLQQDRQRIVNWEAELAEIRPELEAVQDSEAGTAEALQVAEEAMQEWQHAWEEFNQRAAEPRQQAEVQQSRIQHLEQHLRRIAERSDRIQAELRELGVDSLDEEVASLRLELEDCEARVQDREEALATAAEQLELLRPEIEQASTQLSAGRGELQLLLGRKASLEALQEAALQDAAEEQREWLERHDLAARPRLADGLQVTRGWETAVELVLGDRLQAVCIEGFEPILTGVGDCQADLVLVSADRQPIAHDAGFTLAEPLAGYIEAGGVPGALEGVYAVDTLDQALALQPRLSALESVVTRDGLWIGANWVRVARGGEGVGGVLQRKGELEQLQQDITGFESRLADQQSRLETLREQARATEEQREALRRELSDRQRESNDVRTRLGAVQARAEQVLMRRTRAEQELEEVTRQQEQEQAHLAEARGLLQEALDSMENDTQQREALQGQRDTLRAQLEEIRQNARQYRDRMHELAMRERSVSAQLGSIRDGIERLELQVERLRERRESLLAAYAEYDNPAEELQLQLEEQLEHRLKVEGRLEEARREVEGVEQEMRAIEKRRATFEQQLGERRSELERVRLEIRDVETRQRTIEEQFAEQDQALAVVLESLPEEATEAAWEEQLRQLDGRIQRLGAINLAAIDEYRIESERKMYLDAQNAELVEALETLENAIRKIDRETRTRFKETFDFVDRSLQELFPKVFGGGHAYLDLTGDDLLDTGVTIMAQPPGKKNSTIHLLSGGEKALTAIALVFSIFQLNPAPFCMLDEVDAPLDDANVMRYARMVKEMSEKVQFIYITHNKIAMEMASHLMGVTMHEPGVSRMVSVDVDQAAELAEA